MQSSKSPARKTPKKQSRAASSVTAPKKSAKKVSKVPSTRKPAPKPPKRDVSKYVVPEAEHADVMRAKKTYKKSVVEHFIDSVAKEGSTVGALPLVDVDGSSAYTLMRKPEIQTAIAQKRMTLAAECGITSQRIMLEYAAMGFSTMKDYAGLLSADTMVEGLADLTPAQAAAIQELTTETYWDETEEKTVKRVKLKLYPKEVALNKMAQHIGIKGFGGPLAKANASLGVQTIVAPDGTVTTTAVMQNLPDEELERIAAGLDDREEQYAERTE